MKLLSLGRWRREYFDPPIDPRTARDWAKNGIIPGHKIGKQWFIDLEQWTPTSSARLSNRVRDAYNGKLD